jgi:hypothetical protein
MLERLEQQRRLTSNQWKLIITGNLAETRSQSEPAEAQALLLAETSARRRRSGRDRSRRGSTRRVAVRVGLVMWVALLPLCASVGS